jgi:hypothetical protein
MKQFIPFEDNWDALENLRPEDLIPYRVGLIEGRLTAGQRTGPTSPSMVSTSPVCAPICLVVPAASSST